MSIDIEKVLESYFRYNRNDFLHSIEELVPYYDEQLWEDVTQEIKDYIYKTFIGKKINYESPYTCYVSAIEDLLKLETWVYSNDISNIPKDETRRVLEEIEEYFELNNYLTLDDLKGYTIHIYETKEDILSYKIKMCTCIMSDHISYLFFYKCENYGTNN